MLTKRDTEYTNKLYKDRKNKIINMLNNINLSDAIDFKYDIVRYLGNAMKESIQYPYFMQTKIEPNMPCESSLINYIASHMRTYTNEMISLLRDVGTKLNKLSNRIINDIADIKEEVSYLDDVIKKVEANGKTYKNVEAIYDEYVSFESFDDINFISQTTLLIDDATGIVSLRPITEQSIQLPYTIEYIKCINHNKLSIPSRAENEITPGYYFGKFYWPNERFENKDIHNRNTEDIPDTTLNYLSDGDYITGLEMEYVSDDPQDYLDIEIKLTLDNVKKFNTIELSTFTDGEPKWVQIEDLIVDSDSVLEQVLGHELSVRNITLPSTSPYITPNSASPNPTDRYHFASIEGKDIIIRLRQDDPYLISVLHKIGVDINGNTIKDFTYQESYIIVNGIYTNPPVGTPFTLSQLSYDDMRLFDPRIIEYQDIYKDMYRFLIDIRNISVTQNIYTSTGRMITERYKFTSPLSALEIYTDEIIPTNTTLKYYIQFDGLDDIELEPVNRKEAIVTRLVFDSRLNLGKGEKFITDTLYYSFKIKVVMTTDDPTITPILHSIFVRAKISET